MADKIMLSFESDKDLSELLFVLEENEFPFSFEIKRMDMHDIRIKLDRVATSRLRKYVKTIFND